MSKDTIHFPNLNGLRFIAALLVFIHHLEQIKSIFGLPNYWKSIPAVFQIGKLGVHLFFVLSGFLITYLLFVEIDLRSKINLKNFYIRRILRIWPLYFLLVFLGLVVFPQFDIFSFPINTYSDRPLGLITALYLLLMSNLVVPLFGTFPHISHLWSIGAEEQFYLIWPILLGFKKLRTLPVLLSLLGIYAILEIVIQSNALNESFFLSLMKAFHYVFNYSSMIIGGVFAVILFEKRTILKYLLNIRLFYFSLLILITAIAFGLKFPILNFHVFALLFGIIILNLSAHQKLRITLENSWMNELGKISYGLYMFHPFLIVLSINLLDNINMVNPILLSLLSFGLTIFLSKLSYIYFEKKFLALKGKFN